MADLVRTESYIGKKYNFVGNTKTDLILETIGKVYIKKLNLMIPIETLIKKSLGNKSDTVIMILGSDLIIPLQTYPGDGVLIYDPINLILYLTYQEEYLPLINKGGAGNFVKLTGDTMTGLLTIELEDETKPPFVVNTTVLVEDLNADMLDGLHAEDLLQEKSDATILGEWEFNNLVTFADSLGSKNYSARCNSNGWKLDAYGNLVVKDLKVKGKIEECNSVGKDSLKVLITDGLTPDSWIAPKYVIYSVEEIDTSDSVPIRTVTRFGTNRVLYLSVSYTNSETGEVVTIRLESPNLDLSGSNLDFYLDLFDGKYYQILFEDDKGYESVRLGDVLKCYYISDDSSFTSDTVTYYLCFVTNIITDELEGEIYYDSIIVRTSNLNLERHGNVEVSCDNAAISRTVTLDKYSYSILNIPTKEDGEEEDEEEDTIYVTPYPYEKDILVNISRAINLTSIADDSPNIAMYDSIMDPRISTLDKYSREYNRGNTIFKLGNLNLILDKYFTPKGDGIYTNNLVATGSLLNLDNNLGYSIHNGKIQHIILTTPECSGPVYEESGIGFTNDGKLDVVGDDIPFSTTIINYINNLINTIVDPLVTRIKELERKIEELKVDTLPKITYDVLYSDNHLLQEITWKYDFNNSHLIFKYGLLYVNKGSDIGHRDFVSSFPTECLGVVISQRQNNRTSDGYCYYNNLTRFGFDYIIDNDQYAATETVGGYFYAWGW